ncbi:zinc-binding alcohol dehydrogenase family protein [Leifsonia sp. NPDC058194]|uniref:quinone oxidoreductase family protein n=1 Tax=Leifsonia sp. NPDC058194 TaxID=3346374 RepID=UPI0036DF877C
MKAAAYSVNGEPEVLEYVEMPDPVAEAGMVRIRVKYIAIQGGDLANRRHTPPPRPPHIVGYQASGVVDQVGPAVSSVHPGARVVVFGWSGSHAQLLTVDERHVFRVPDGLSLRAAATIPVEFGTASDALFEFARMTEGETVAVRGAAGGVGLATVSLARNAGARVIAIAAQPQRVQKIVEFGADAGIDYLAEDVPARVMELTDGRGADVVIDLAGGSPLLEALAFRGRYGLVGGASGKAVHWDPRSLATKSATLFGFGYGGVIGTHRARVVISSLLREAEGGRIGIPIDRVYPLSLAAGAHSYAEAKRPVGRVLLDADA